MFMYTYVYITYVSRFLQNSTVQLLNGIYHFLFLWSPDPKGCNSTILRFMYHPHSCSATHNACNTPHSQNETGHASCSCHRHLLRPKYFRMAYQHGWQVALSQGWLDEWLNSIFFFSVPIRNLFGLL